MSVGLLLITHEGIGEQLLRAARAIMVAALPNEALGVRPDDAPERIGEAVVAAMQRLDRGDGVLALCDLYGATPCNAIRRRAADANLRIITGCNLPMVLKIFNYAALDVDQLAAKALEGGKTGILKAPAPHCPARRP